MTVNAELNDTQCHRESSEPYSFYVKSTVHLYKIHLPWWWRQKFAVRCRRALKRLHGVTSQKTEILVRYIPLKLESQMMQYVNAVCLIVAVAGFFEWQNTYMVNGGNCILKFLHSSAKLPLGLLSLSENTGRFVIKFDTVIQMAAFVPGERQNW